MLGAILGGAGAALLGAIGQERSNRFSAREAQRNREFNAAEAVKQREFNAFEAQKARDFSAEQSATEVRRRVEDLKAAGLNPALALGQTASSGGGVAATGQSASSGSLPQFGNAGASAVSSALSAVQLARAVQEVKIQRELADASISKTRAETSDIAATQAARVKELWTRADLSTFGARRQEFETDRAKALFALDEQLLRMSILQTRNSAAESDARSRDIAARMAREEQAFRTGFGRLAPWINSANAMLRATLDEAFGPRAGRGLFDRRWREWNRELLRESPR